MFRNKDWKITQVIEDDGTFRIEARRPPVKNEFAFFIGYGGREYIGNLANTFRGCGVHELVEAN